MGYGVYICIDCGQIVNGDESVACIVCAERVCLACRDEHEGECVEFGPDEVEPVPEEPTEPDFAQSV